MDIPTKDTNQHPLCKISEVKTIHDIIPEGIVIDLLNGETIYTGEIRFEDGFIFEVRN